MKRLAQLFGILLGLIGSFVFWKDFLVYDIKDGWTLAAMICFPAAVIGLVYLLVNKK